MPERKWRYYVWKNYSIRHFFTEGDDMKQAYEMAVEALRLALVNRKEEKEAIPEPSDLDKIKNEEGTIVIVEFDILESLV